MDLDQSCQTGVTRAACGPISCLIRPALTFLISFMTKNYSKLHEFAVIYSIKQLQYGKIDLVLLLFIRNWDLRTQKLRINFLVKLTPGGRGVLIVFMYDS